MVTDQSTARGNAVRVYHFLPAKFALEDIEERRIKLSEINQLNDPFELWYIAQPDRRLREVMREFRIDMGKKFAVLCFSKRWHNPLLWSHYAEMHRGICLGFDVDDRGLKPVSYVTKRPILQFPITVEHMQQLLYAKYRGWRYEEEWRNWFSIDDRDPSGFFFYPFDQFVQLKEVIVGPLCDVPKERIEEALQPYQDRISITKVRLAFNSFKVVKNRRGFRG